MTKSNEKYPELKIMDNLGIGQAFRIPCDTTEKHRYSDGARIALAAQDRRKRYFKDRSYSCRIKDGYLLITRKK